MPLVIFVYITEKTNRSSLFYQNISLQSSTQMLESKSSPQKIKIFIEKFFTNEKTKLGFRYSTEGKENLIFFLP